MKEIRSTRPDFRGSASAKLLLTSAARSVVGASAKSGFDAAVVRYRICAWSVASDGVRYGGSLRWVVTSIWDAADSFAKLPDSRPESAPTASYRQQWVRSRGD